MRQLVACPACARQYDVSGRSAGERFHCSCGVTLRIPKMESHDAAVVRCSACGGPRRAGEKACSFCHASFTLHERDLNTICPHCASRISDRARFCHHCARAIDANAATGEESESNCPACGDGHKLYSRRFGSETLSVLECGACAGLWVGTVTLDALVDRAKDRAAGGGAARPSALPTMPAQGALYRPCVVCGKLMNRQNYGRRSGVIIDRCADHGVWFDDQELAYVLEWVRSGGLDQTRALDQERVRAEARLRGMGQPASPAGGGPMLDFDPDGGFDPSLTPGDLLTKLGGFLWRALSR